MSATINEKALPNILEKLVAKRFDYIPSLAASWRYSGVNRLLFELTRHTLPRNQHHNPP